MGTNCFPFLADLFLYKYEADLIKSLLKKQKKLTRSFNFTFRYIDDVLSLNNSKFGDFFDRIYPIELEIKDTTDTARSASYLSIHLEFHNKGRLRTKLYHKREDFSIMNFPFICSNIPVAPHLHMAVDPIFQSLWFLSWCPRMLRNTAIFGVKHQSINQSIKLKKKLLNQGILVVKLKSLLRKFYGRHHDFGNRYGVSVSQMITDIFRLS